jgi:hypothetical protein
MNNATMNIYREKRIISSRFYWRSIRNIKECWSRRCGRCISSIKETGILLNNGNVSFVSSIDLPLLPSSNLNLLELV